MIIFARRLAFLASLLAVCATAFAQSTPPVDPAQILKELEQIQKDRSNQFKSGLNSHIQSLSAAAASKQAAITAYEDATQAVEYEGKPKDGSEFASWREKNKELLLDDSFRTALQLHLQYIVLSLKRLDGQKTEEAIPSLLDYVARLGQLLSDCNKQDKGKNDVQAKNEKFRPKDKQGDKGKGTVGQVRDFLNKGLSASVFVRWYRLEGHVANLKDWEPNSGNIEGIVDKTLMPYMREKKDARLITLWDERIARAQESAQKSDLAIDADKYQNQTLPSLMWSRAQDRVVLGQRSAAMGEMLNIIRSYQSHPDFDKWIKDLTSLAKGESADGGN
jgi:hypothetical protein